MTANSGFLLRSAPMITIHGIEYQWAWWTKRFRNNPAIKLAKYEGNLVAIKEHLRGFLAEYSHTYRGDNNRQSSKGGERTRVI